MSELQDGRALAMAGRLYQGQQWLAAAVVYAELAQAGTATAELWCGLGCALLNCRGQLVRAPFELWAARVFRHGAPILAGTPYQEPVDDRRAELADTDDGAPLDQAALAALIDFLMVEERVLARAAAALDPGAALDLVMTLGERTSPLYMPLMRAAVMGELGVAAARAALKRLDRFIAWPEVQAAVLIAHTGATAAELAAHLAPWRAVVPADADQPRPAAAPPYRGLGDVAIELTAVGPEPAACAELIRQHLGAAPRDARAWVAFAPCVIKLGATRADALRLQQALAPLGATVELGRTPPPAPAAPSTTIAPFLPPPPPPPPPAPLDDLVIAAGPLTTAPVWPTLRYAIYESPTTTLFVEGDVDGCRFADTEGWEPFTRAIDARLNGTTVPDLSVTPADGDYAHLVPHWHDEIGDEEPLTFAFYYQHGVAVLAPTQAEQVFARRAREQWEYWAWPVRRAVARQAPARRIDALVDRQARTVDWAAPDPAVLAALEAQVRAFEDLDPDEPAARALHEPVHLAVAAAGILDGARRDLGRWPRLAAWQQAATDLRAYARQVSDLAPAGARSVLASHVALAWFLRGPYAGATEPPHAMLAKHLRSWLEHDRDEPSHYDMFDRGFSGRAAWRTGVGGVQQLYLTGTPVAEVDWRAQASGLAASATRAKHPRVAAHLAAFRVAHGEDELDWHGPTELGLALAWLALAPVAHHPLGTAHGPLTPAACAAAGRAYLARACTLNPSLRRASWHDEVMTALAAAGLDDTPAPPPRATFAAELIAHSGPVPLLRELPSALRVDIRDFLARRGIPAIDASTALP